jgi:predicted NUDIX family NTP pyrophosphohydrolase
MKESAGTLLYRNRDQHLVVHPSGNYNRRAPWGIPKGELDLGESYEQAARRETLEETGISTGTLQSLGYVDYTKSRKRVHCFTAEAEPNAVASCNSWEIDRCEFLNLEDSRRLIQRVNLFFWNGCLSISKILRMNKLEASTAN